MQSKGRLQPHRARQNPGKSRDNNKAISKHFVHVGEPLQVAAEKDVRFGTQEEKKIGGTLYLSRQKYPSIPRPHGSMMTCKGSPF